MQKYYQANPNFISRNIAGANILVAVGAGVADFRGYIQMNPTAEKIWTLLQNRISEEEITDALFEDFDAPRDIIARDVQEILQMLLDKGMVTVYDA